MIPGDPLVRQVTSADTANLSFLINNAEYIHRHLDWRAPLDWIGAEPFLVIDRQHRLLSALACPRIDSRVGWIRLFAFLNWNTPQLEGCWNQLFQALCAFIPPHSGYVFAALGLQPWFSGLLRGSGFYHRQDIMVLEWMGETPPLRPLPAEITIRTMLPRDLPGVLVIDNLAFDPLWRHSPNELDLAFLQAAYATVAELNGEIVAYQISTGTPFHAHLARLAVDPGLQRLSLGYGLVRDVLVHFTGLSIPNITVNTQSDNHQSLGLYQKTGFLATGEDFPVLVYPAS